MHKDQKLPPVPQKKIPVEPAEDLEGWNGSGEDTHRTSAIAETEFSLMNFIPEMRPHLFRMYLKVREQHLLPCTIADGVLADMGCFVYLLFQTYLPHLDVLLSQNNVGSAVTGELPRFFSKHTVGMIRGDLKSEHSVMERVKCYLPYVAPEEIVRGRSSGASRDEVCEHPEHSGLQQTQTEL